LLTASAIFIASPVASWSTATQPYTPSPFLYFSRTNTPGALGTNSTVFTSFGGVIWPYSTENRGRKHSVCPARRFGPMSFL
jgi:hypothetical protein